MFDDTCTCDPHMEQFCDQCNGSDELWRQYVDGPESTEEELTADISTLTYLAAAKNLGFELYSALHTQ